jgi:translation initiation factor 1A
MPNQQGGKNYKKSKHSTGDTVVRLEEAGPEELYGRVIKILGNLNMNVYCNDNKIRICKVRGSMRKRVWINIGDLVIISLRNFAAEEDKKAMTEAERKLIDRGDIVHKIDPNLHSKAKKLQGINQKLFIQLENTDGKVLEEIGTKHSGQVDANDCGIEFDEDARVEEEDEEDEDESDKEEEGVVKPKKLKGKTRENKLAVATKRDQDDADLEVNIDDI